MDFWIPEKPRKTQDSKVPKIREAKIKWSKKVKVTMTKKIKKTPSHVNNEISYHIVAGQILRESGSLVAFVLILKK